MPIENVTAAAQQYGTECADAARAAAAAEYEPVIAALRAEIERLTPTQPDPNTPPDGYRVVTDTGADVAALLKRGPVALVGGQFKSPANIDLTDDSRGLWVGPDASLLRTAGGGSGTSVAWFRNETWTRRIAGFKVNGPGTIDAGGKGGNVFGLLADDLELADFNVVRWTGGRLCMTAGDRHHYHDFTARCVEGTSSGVGGIRFGGGTDFVGERLDVTSGDDVFQFVPAGATNDPLFNVADTTNGVYRDCVGRSYSARLCIVALQDSANDGTKRLGMSVGVRGFRFENVTGQHGGSAVVVKNSSSSGGVSGGVFTGVVSEHVPGPNVGQPGHVYVEGFDGLGVVRDVDLSGVKIKPADKRPVFRSKGPLSGITAPAA